MDTLARAAGLHADSEISSGALAAVEEAALDFVAAGGVVTLSEWERLSVSSREALASARSTAFEDRVMHAIEVFGRTAQASSEDAAASAALAAAVAS